MQKSAWRSTKKRTCADAVAGDVAAAYGEVAAAVRELADHGRCAGGGGTNQLELLRARAAQGAVPTLDRDMVDVEVRRIQAERMVQAGRVDRALVRLKRLLGMPPDTPLRVTQSLEELWYAVTPEDRATVADSPRRSSLGGTRPCRGATSRCGKSEGRPDVSVFGSYMRMDAGFPQQGVIAWREPGAVRGRVQLLHAWRDGHLAAVESAAREPRRSSGSTGGRRSTGSKRATADAASEVAEARAWHEQAREPSRCIEDGIRPLARRNLDTVRETYQLGRATVFDVLAEQRRYLEAERAYTEALSDAYASRVSLGRATGSCSMTAFELSWPAVAAAACLRVARRWGRLPVAAAAGRHRADQCGCWVRRSDDRVPAVRRSLTSSSTCPRRRSRRRGSSSAPVTVSDATGTFVCRGRAARRLWSSGGRAARIWTRHTCGGHAW